MIYGLTTFEKITETRCGKKKNLKLFDFGNVQFKGYFFNLDSALTALLINRSQLHSDEDKCKYCIIEEIPEGIMKYTPNRYLFEWQTDRYVQVDEPQTLHYFTNFANH